MQARLRRNRIVMLGAVLFGIASTSGIQSIPAAMQRSWAADTTFAATTVIRANEMNAQVITGPVLPDGDLTETEDANAYDATDWWKADLYEYDDSFSLTSYEAAELEPETITTTTASTTDATEETVTTTITTFEEPAITAKHTITADPNSVVF